MQLSCAQKDPPFLAVGITFTICSVPAQSDGPFSRKRLAAVLTAFQTRDGVCRIAEVRPVATRLPSIIEALDMLLATL